MKLKAYSVSAETFTAWKEAREKAEKVDHDKAAINLKFAVAIIAFGAMLWLGGWGDRTTILFVTLAALFFGSIAHVVLLFRRDFRLRRTLQELEPESMWGRGIDVYEIQVPGLKPLSKDPETYVLTIWKHAHTYSMSAPRFVKSQPPIHVTVWKVLLGRLLGRLRWQSA